MTAHKRKAIVWHTGLTRSRWLAALRYSTPPTKEWPHALLARCEVQINRCVLAVQINLCAGDTAVAAGAFFYKRRCIVDDDWWWLMTNCNIAPQQLNNVQFCTHPTPPTIAYTPSDTLVPFSYKHCSLHRGFFFYKRLNWRRCVVDDDWWWLIAILHLTNVQYCTHSPSS